MVAAHLSVVVCSPVVAARSKGADNEWGCSLLGVLAGIKSCNQPERRLVLAFTTITW
jgi:hypothetical protein